MEMVVGEPVDNGGSSGYGDGCGGIKVVRSNGRWERVAMELNGIELELSPAVGQWDGGGAVGDGGAVVGVWWQRCDGMPPPVVDAS